MREMGLVLQGGGALGAYEYGVIVRLVELGWRPKVLTGVSIGAINGAVIAGSPDEKIIENLHRLWKTITLPQLAWLPENQQAFLSMFGNRNFYLPRIDYFNCLSWVSLCDVSPMLTTLERLCDFDLINDSNHRRYAVTTTNVCTGGQETFSNYFPDTARVTPDHADKIERENAKSYNIRLTPKHIMASGSLPPNFPFTKVHGKYYWDGGLFCNTPIEALLDLLTWEDIDALPIFVVNLYASKQPLPENLLQVSERMMELTYQNRFWAQYGGTSRLTGFIDMLGKLDEELPENGSARKHRAYYWLQRLRAIKNIQVIQAEPGGMTGGMDFSPYGVKKRYTAGREAVDRHFQKPFEKRGPAVSRQREEIRARQKMPTEMHATH